MPTKGCSKRGLALSEVLVVLAVTGILASLLLFMLPRIIENAKKTSDVASLKLLDQATTIYKTTNNIGGSDAFKGIYTDSARLKALYDSGNIDRITVPRTEEGVFSWGLYDQKWGVVHVVSGREVEMAQSGGFTGRIMGSYSGDEKIIKIPASINGTTVKEVHQDVFKDKGLTSLVLEEGIERLHARSFMDNDLTEIVLPNSLTRLDYGAFLNNPLTKVTIGPNVTIIEGKVFPNNESFTAAYNAGGAGTYILIGGVWFKQ
ncbi:MAG: leucine-rich repeat protein [Synergistaceae bacterium]